MVIHKCGVFHHYLHQFVDHIECCVGGQTVESDASGFCRGPWTGVLIILLLARRGHQARDARIVPLAHRSAP